MNSKSNVLADGVSAHKNFMMDLSESLSPIADLISGQPFVYLDIPVYDNVGDLLIMQGAMSFFKRHELSPTHVRSVHNFSPEIISKNNVIVFQGGGNFGDLYPVLQNHREAVINKYPENRVIILPQTIYFESDDNYKACCKKLKGHPDLHICVRDERSFNLAKEMTKNVYLLPDMAHALYPLEQANRKSIPYKDFRLMRSDIERRSNIGEAGSSESGGSEEGDWGFFLGRYSVCVKWHRRFQKRLKRFGLNRFTGFLTSYLWACQVEKILSSILAGFSGFKNIETDRLHGHILACLLDKPSCVHDNSYGKNISYVKAWTLRSPIVKLAIAAE